MNIINTESSPLYPANQLLAYLRSLREDRGAMANLRCALAPNRRFQAWPLLTHVRESIGNKAIETVAGLFAFHPADKPIGNFGITCQHIAKHFRRDDGTSTFDHRFIRLLSCNQTELCLRLRPLVFTAKAKEIPIDYEKLLKDLLSWDKEKDEIRIHWAKAYWDNQEHTSVATEQKPEVES
jgi:CRISPR system Cascade subunit CasB